MPGVPRDPRESRENRPGRVASEERTENPGAQWHCSRMRASPPEFAVSPSRSTFPRNTFQPFPIHRSHQPPISLLLRLFFRLSPAFRRPPASPSKSVCFSEVCLLFNKVVSLFYFLEACSPFRRDAYFLVSLRLSVTAEYLFWYPARLDIRFGKRYG